jgi:hypothetical protein
MFMRQSQILAYESLDGFDKNPRGNGLGGTSIPFCKRGKATGSSGDDQVMDVNSASKNK